ncbi:MAG: translocation/assembly module TamB, partial [Proteobacteria bacterium]
MGKKIHPYLRKTLKVLAWTIGSVIGLFLLIVVLLQVPAVQNFAKDKAVAYLEDKIKTRVEVKTIEIGLPKKVILTGVYFEDQKKDTLLAGERLAVDISLFKLLSSEVEINSVALKGITANISRDKDSVFNFQYIIDAFDSKEPKKKDSKPMKISVKKIDLDNIRFKLNDAISKNAFAAKLDHFDTQFNRFDLDGMDFDIPRIKLAGLKLTLDQGLVEQIAVTSVKVADTVSKRPDFKLKLGTIELSKIKLGYDNVGSKLNTGVSLGRLLLDFDQFDMNKQLVALNNFEIQDVYGNLALGKADKQVNAPDTDTTAIKKDGWNLQLSKINIANVNFKFDDLNAAAAPKGIDYKHLNLRGFNLKAQKFNYAENHISGNIDAFTVKEKSGLDIQSLRTDFVYTDKGAQIRNLYLKTPQTLLRDQISVGYPSLDAVKANPGAIAFSADINQSRIGFKDILIFVPNLQADNPFKSNPNAILLVDTKLSGRLGDIRFPNFSVSGIGGTSIAASGRITGLPDSKKAYFDIDIKNLRTTSKDINNFVPKGKMPASISLPSVLALRGKLKGSLNNFKTNMNLVSSYGNANVKADFDQRVKNHEKYNADVSLNNFAIGKLIKNDSLGKITVTAKVKGTGLNPKTANAIADILVSKAEFNHYTYKNLALKGDIKAGKFNIDSGMNDPNLTFKMDANGGFGGKYPAVDLRLNVDIA